MNDDRVWEMYFQDRYQAATQEACRARIDWLVAEAARGGGEVLDLGCSQGVLPILLARRGVTVLGVDVEAPAIAFAQARRAEEPAEVQARVTFVCADAGSWDPGRRFATVVLGEVLEHLPEPALLIAAARRYLVDGGRLLVTVPLGWLPHPDHRQAFMPTDLLALLGDGFGVRALELAEEKIHVVAERGGVTDPAVVAPARLLRELEREVRAQQHRLARVDDEHRARAGRFQAREEVHQRQVARLEERLAKAEAKAVQASERVAAERARFQARPSFQLGRLLVGVRRDPTTAVRLPGQLARLAVDAWRGSDAGPTMTVGKAGGGGGGRSKVRDAEAVYRGAYRVDVPGATPVTPASERRVLHLLEYTLPHTQNGYTLRSFNIVKAQLGHGWEPRVVTPPGFPVDAPAAEPEQVAGVPHFRLAAPAGFEKTDLARYVEAYVRGAAPLVQRERPAIIQAASNFRNAYPALELARAFGVPSVYEVRGLWEETRVANGTLDRGDDRFASLVEVESYCARTADAVVTLGEALKGELVERGVDPAKIFLVHNAVELPPDALRPPRPELRAELGLDGKFVVAYIGSVSRLESLHVLIEAIAALGSTRPDIAAMIVGDGAALAELRQQASTLGVADRVRFVGAVPHAQVPDYYALTDAVVCTRGPDRVCSVVTPLKPYEAMAYRKAVVVSDVPALREMVQDGVTGTIVPPLEPRALAAALVQLADDPARRAALGAQAAAWVAEHRSWARVTAGYEAAYAYARAAHARRVGRS